MNRNRLTVALLALLLIVGLGAPAAAQVTITYTFAADTIADPDQVNANFSALSANALNRTGGTLTGNLAVNPGVTVDGIDVGAVLGGTGTPTFTTITVTGAAGVGSLSSGAISGTTGAFSGAVTATSVTGSANGGFATLTSSNTGATSIDVAGGITAGTGNVGIVDTTGKIPAISSTYFASLSGANITGISGTNVTTGTLPSSVGGVPAGMLGHFNLGACPTGWTDITATYQGRYLVAKYAAQSLGDSIGTALTNGENRAAGVHNHTATSNSVVTESPHQHTYNEAAGFGDGDAGATGDIYNGNGAALTSPVSTGLTVATTTTVNNSAGVAGTNAPYSAFLLCVKN